MAGQQSPEPALCHREQRLIVPQGIITIEGKHTRQVHGSSSFSQSLPSGRVYLNSDDDVEGHTTSTVPAG
jgi:hypothetical protein